MYALVAGLRVLLAARAWAPPGAAIGGPEPDGSYATPEILDKAGNVQTDQWGGGDQSRPGGATGRHSITFTVVWLRHETHL